MTEQPLTARIDWRKVTDIGELRQACQTFEAVLRAEQGVMFEDGYEVNVAALKYYVEELRKYARHLHECAFLREADSAASNYGKCTCGLNDLLDLIALRPNG